MKSKFLGVTSDGSEKKGAVSADSEDEALRKLKAAGIFVTHIDTVETIPPAATSPSTTEQVPR